LISTIFSLLNFIHGGLLYWAYRGSSFSLPFYHHCQLLLVLVAFDENSSKLSLSFLFCGLPVFGIAK